MVLATDHDAAETTLGSVVVDRHVWIVEEAEQALGPHVTHVLDGIAQTTARQRAHAERPLLDTFRASDFRRIRAQAATRSEQDAGFGPLQAYKQWAQIAFSRRASFEKWEHYAFCCIERAHFALESVYLLRDREADQATPE